MSATFTPGPWLADFPQVIAIIDGVELVICDVRHAGTYNKNEFLISAAPELRAACEAFRDFGLSHHLKLPLELVGPWQNLVDDATKALEKADRGK